MQWRRFMLVGGQGYSNLAERSEWALRELSSSRFEDFFWRWPNFHAERKRLNDDSSAQRLHES